MRHNLALRAVRKVIMTSNAPPKSHIKARCKIYPRSEEERAEVPDDKVKWTVEYKDYNPKDYTAESVLDKPVWADPDYRKEKPKEGAEPKWNQIDGKINRKSFMGEYKTGEYTFEGEEGGKVQLPLNIVGRTGVCSRGLLGRWGPNHAADPIVTRWKREGDKKVMHKDSKKHILQFIAIQRRDTGEWAIPGGMVDPGENVTVTLRREFSEEALNILGMTKEERETILNNVNELFKGGKEVYKGYVDDPRNTDNAWMETVAVNFHDEKGDSVSKFKLHAGDDAVGVKWMDLNSDVKLYASHVEFCKKVVDHHGAHWKKMDTTKPAAKSSDVKKGQGSSVPKR